MRTELTPDQRSHLEKIKMRHKSYAKLFELVYTNNCEGDPIRAKCIDCMGYDFDNIKLGCNIDTCPLWHKSPIKKNS